MDKTITRGELLSILRYVAKQQTHGIDPGEGDGIGYSIASGVAGALDEIADAIETPEFNHQMGREKP